jgi:hypothetical protein
LGVLPVTTLRSGTRRVLSLAVLALVWASTALPLASGILASFPGCGTNCCRSKKNCCCRKKGAPASGQLPSVSARVCPVGCGQLPSVVSDTLHGVVPAQAAIVTLLTATEPVLAITPWVLPLAFAFALFGRPPPRPLPLLSVLT